MLTTWPRARVVVTRERRARRRGQLGDRRRPDLCAGAAAGRPVRGHRGRRSTCRARTATRWRPCSTKPGSAPRGLADQRVRVCATGSTATCGVTSWSVRCRERWPTPIARAGPPDRRRRAGLRTSRSPRVRSPARICSALDLQDPGAATGFGIGGGAGPLRAGVQPAGPL